MKHPSCYATRRDLSWSSDHSSICFFTLLLTMVMFLNLCLAPRMKHAYEDHKIDGEMTFTCEAFNRCLGTEFRRGPPALFFPIPTPSFRYFLGTVFFLGWFPVFVICVAPVFLFSALQLGSITICGT